MFSFRLILKLIQCYLEEEKDGVDSKHCYHRNFTFLMYFSNNFIECACCNSEDNAFQNVTPLLYGHVRITDLTVNFSLNLIIVRAT